MKPKDKLFIHPKFHPFGAVLMIGAILLFGVLASSAQTGIYLFTGSMTTITLNPGTYDITAYGAQGGTGSALLLGVNQGGLGAEMEGQFNFTAPATLTLLVGGSGSSCVNGYGGGGGGGGFYGGGGGGNNGGGGGGSIIDSSATMVLAEVSGVASPNGSPNGEIIITAVPVPEPSALVLLVIGASTFMVRRSSNAYANKETKMAS